jgi:hypothetical protein
MNSKQVHKFVHRYLEATDCRILEKSPAHFTVKLSLQADKELTNRPYYWGFVERTGAEPETMTFLFVTDKEKYDSVPPVQASTDPAAATATEPANGAVDAALGRSFGYTHGTLAVGRTPREDIYFGSRRLNQLFDAVATGGRYVCLFQEPGGRALHPFESTAYTPWLGVNLKVEFVCDRKREELHSFGVSLATGICEENFHERLLGLRMTPKLPANVHIAKNGISLNKAVANIDAALERKLRSCDYEWAVEASARLAEELRLIRHYYEPLIESAEEDKKQEIAAQFDNRQAEINWQYQPRVSVTAINCGIFHLAGID